MIPLPILAWRATICAARFMVVMFVAELLPQASSCRCRCRCCESRPIVPRVNVQCVYCSVAIVLLCSVIDRNVGQWLSQGGVDSQGSLDG